MSSKKTTVGVTTAMLITVSPISLSAQQESMSPSVGMFGTTGLIDVPSAESQRDAELITTVSRFSDFTRGTFTFQILPRLSGTFRYSKLDNWFREVDVSQYDRSFDVQYRVLDEGKYTPSVAVGLRDFLGTGIYSSQYIVATKNLSKNFKATAGLGWGRLSGSEESTFESGTLGGTFDVGSWFRGSVGAFGGIEWQTPIERLRFKAEYSPDKYANENVIRGIRTAASFERKSPFNFGLEYQTKGTASIGAYYLYGSEFGIRLSSAINPKKSSGGYKDRSPLPIAVRDNPNSQNVAWTQSEGIDQRVHDQLNKYLNKDGIVVESVYFSGVHAEVRIRNNKYKSAAHAFGRTSRAMAKVFPDSVQSFTIVPVEKGLATSALTVKRSDLEELEFKVNGASSLGERVELTDAGPLPEGGEYSQNLYPRFKWGLAPFAELTLFNADDPLNLTAGIRLKANWEVTRGLTFGGSVSKNIISDSSTPTFSTSGIEPVRSNVGFYRSEGDPSLDTLTGQYMFKITPSVYGRVTAGYLEKMFGGVSAEVLWKEVDRKWGLGAELNYVKQRDFDQRLGFQDYSVLTGHVSAYLELPKDFEVQVDVGRYLAGDVGATLSVDRTFNNGWRVGAYATITDVSAEDFGEGSFDKGIRLEIPLGVALGTATKTSSATVLSSLTRDGGARLNVDNRLYPIVRDQHASNVSGSWGLFFK